MRHQSDYPPERLVAYDPAWTDLYAAAALDLVDCLGTEWRVEHVGSTSVPEMVAKPVIDLAVRVLGRSDLDSVISVLCDAGWTEPVPVGAHRTIFGSTAQCAG